MTKTTVYTKPACADCNKTKNYLNSLGVEYDEIDLTQDPEALEQVKALGFLRAPVVAAEGAMWSGFDEHKIREFCI